MGYKINITNKPTMHTAIIGTTDKLRGIDLYHSAAISLSDSNSGMTINANQTCVYDLYYSVFYEP